MVAPCVGGEYGGGLGGMDDQILVWRAVLLGEPVSKANQRRPALTGRRSRRWRFIKSEKALGWEGFVREQLRMLRIAELIPVGVAFPKEPVCVTAHLWYRTERPDLDESLLLDLLQGYAYTNDRQVKAKIIYHGIDRENPRADVHVLSLVRNEPADRVPFGKRNMARLRRAHAEP